MTTPTKPEIMVRLERLLEASPETVYRALSDPAHLVRWYAPSDDFVVEVHEWDLRPGGRFRISMKHRAGTVHTPVGVFREVVPGRRICHTWTWEGEPVMDTLVTLEIVAAPGGTAITLTHTGFPSAEAAGKHQEGWVGCLARLAETVTS